jgi:hypothetical protein
MHFYKQLENSNMPQEVMGQPRGSRNAKSPPSAPITVHLRSYNPAPSYFCQLLLQKIYPVILSRLINSSLILLDEQGVH